MDSKLRETELVSELDVNVPVKYSILVEFWKTEIPVVSFEVKIGFDSVDQEIS